jgi:uncharacterized protein YqgC (DUF456 family)
METAILTVAAVLAIVGVLGNLVPAVPGTPLNYLAIMILHFVRDAQAFSITLLVFLGVLTIVALVVDYALPLMAARKFGATKYGLWGSVIGMIVGFIVFNIIGMLLGMFAGAITGELYARKKFGAALTAGVATMVGNALAAVFRLGVSAAMTVVFFAELFWGTPAI